MCRTVASPLDRLLATPEMTVVMPAMPEPASARPSLDRHRQGRPVRCFVRRAHLFEERVKRGVQRGTHVDLVCEIQREVVECGCCESHPLASFSRIRPFGRPLSIGLSFGALLDSRQLMAPEALERLREVVQRPEGLNLGAIKDLASLSPHIHEADVA